MTIRIFSHLLILTLFFYFVFNLFYYKEDKIYLGKYYLQSFYQENMYFLYKKYEANNFDVPLYDGIVDMQETENYYVLYGFDVKLCDKDSIYYIWNNKKIYYILNKRTEHIEVIDNYYDFKNFKKLNKLDIKDSVYPKKVLENFALEKNLERAKRDGCI